MRNKIILVAMLMLALLVAAGCGGGSGVQRQSGLSPEAVIQNFFDAAKDNQMKEAALYVSPTSASDTKTVLKYVTGESSSTIKNSNLLSVKKVAQQGDYAAAVVTLQAEQNSMNVSVKPVGLEKIDGEWYIVDYDQALREAKYKVLAQLLSRI
ncbi:DUF4878 domain-containing protein [Sporomusa sphaeroides DSM 2875]|uniref:DUF4878 domain-containing protein n=1 Tax=Sporomusa sphaeroides TaxID=47679 RepID=UPI0020305E31|nr:DUF4878 domain-containing protein [Sporomusa sphaeroides]MCM0760030.1 DUF4878 domain-containing protein [Sporomusa sphaeroides DSM 2875]